MKQLLFALSALLILSASCKKSKSDDNDACPVTKENVAGTYKIVSFKVNGVDAIDIYFEECEKDDLITLNTNSTYTRVDAGTKCTPAGDGTGDWDLNGNTFTIDVLPVDLQITSFDCTTLRGTANVGGNSVEGVMRKQ